METTTTNDSATYVFGPMINIEPAGEFADATFLNRQGSMIAASYADYSFLIGNY